MSLMSNPSWNPSLLAAAVAGGVVTGVAMSKIATSFQNPIVTPEKWTQVAKVSKLVIHPVKTLPGIEVSEAVLTPLGLQDVSNPLLQDRTFMIINEKMDCVTSRQIPILILIFPSLSHDVMTLTFKRTGESVSFKIPSHTEGEKSVRIWWDKVKAVDCGDKVAQWISMVSETPNLRLVYHGGKVSRTLHSSHKSFPLFRKQDVGIFADETAFMLASEESLEDLNSRIPKPQLLMKAFRPTIIVSGVPEPWAEDLWSFVRIGDDQEKSPILKTCKPCQRCKVTTLDTETATFREDGEPLKTLRALKRPIGNAKITKVVENTAVFGNNFGMFKNENTCIRVGDTVYTALL